MEASGCTRAQRDSCRTGDPSSDRWKPKLLSVSSRRIEWWIRCMEGVTSSATQGRSRRSGNAMSVWVIRLPSRQQQLEHDDRRRRGPSNADQSELDSPSTSAISNGWKRTPVVTSNATSLWCTRCRRHSAGNHVMQAVLPVDRAHRTTAPPARTPATAASPRTPNRPPCRASTTIARPTARTGNSRRSTSAIDHRPAPDWQLGVATIGHRRVSASAIATLPSSKQRGGECGQAQSPRVATRRSRSMLMPSALLAGAHPRRSIRCCSRCSVGRRWQLGAARQRRSAA